MHRKSRFEYSCTSHSQSQHMCLNGYPRAIQRRDYYLQHSDIIAWASYIGVLQHQTIICETWANLTVLGSPWIWESGWGRWNTAMEMRLGEKGKPGNWEETPNSLQWILSNPEIRFFVLNWAQASYSPRVMVMQEGWVTHVVGFQLFNRLCKVWSVWWQTGRRQGYSLGQVRLRKYPQRWLLSCLYTDTFL